MNAPFDADAVAREACAGAEAVIVQGDGKRPLFRPPPPAAEFPVDALGALREVADAIHETVRAPLVICAQSALAAATLAIQAHNDVVLPGAGRRPLTGLFVSVADSGERKSSVDRIALRPVHEAERQFRDEARAEADRYVNVKETWEAARAHAKKLAKDDRDKLRHDLDAIGPAAKAPPHPMLLVADPTPEGLVMHLAEDRPWGGVFTAEGGLLIGGSAFNEETRMRTGALFNASWDGEAIRRKRVLTGTHYLPGRRCSAHVMMQPIVATKLFADATLDGIGTLARTLVVAPESTAGTRLFRAPAGFGTTILADYTARLLALLRKPPAR